MVYPWNILGLAEDCDDIRLIKRAYAQKLKSCRPDENPKGFQKLVQARDHALLYIKNSGLSECVAKKEEQAKPLNNIQDKSVDALLDDGAGLLYNRLFFERQLEVMNDPKLDIWDIGFWENFLNALNNADFQCRNDVEWLLIRQVGSHLLERVPTPEQSHKDKEKVLDVLQLLNEEFGWDESDQKIYKVLGKRDADLFLALIRSRLSEINGKQDAAIPYIAISDLRALMGNRGESIVQYYLSAWQTGHWPKGFVWPEGVHDYLWGAWRSMRNIGLGVLLFQCGMMWLLVQWEGRSFLFTSTVICMLSFLPIILLARFGSYYIIQSLVSQHARAEDLPFDNSLERYHYLEKKGRGNIMPMAALMLFPFLVYLVMRFSVSDVLRLF